MTGRKAGLCRRQLRRVAVGADVVVVCAVRREAWEALLGPRQLCTAMWFAVGIAVLRVLKGIEFPRRGLFRIAALGPWPVEMSSLAVGDVMTVTLCSRWPPVPAGSFWITSARPSPGKLQLEQLLDIWN